MGDIRRIKVSLNFGKVLRAMKHHPSILKKVLLCLLFIFSVLNKTVKKKEKVL